MQVKEGGIATDFVDIQCRQRTKNGSIEIYPEFITKKSKDLMIRGGDFTLSGMRVVVAGPPI